MLMCVLILLQVARFRQLLKEAIILNDRLREYTERQLSSCAATSSDDSQNLTSLKSADKSDNNADSDSEQVVNDPCKNPASTQSEKRIVRIVPTRVTQNHSSSTSAAASESDVKSLPVIDKMESVNIQVHSDQYTFHLGMLSKVQVFELLF